MTNFENGYTGNGYMGIRAYRCSPSKISVHMFDLAYKNEVNRFVCTTRNRLDFDLANKNEVNRFGCNRRNRLDFDLAHKMK